MRRSVLVALVAAAACGGGGAPPPEPAAAEPAPETRPPPREPPIADPAGLWPARVARARLEALAERGVELSPGALDELEAAAVRVGACAGAFVSPEGLAVTSQRCIADSSSRLDEVVEADGFLADGRDTELRAWPSLALRVLLGDEDVTDEVREGLEEIDGDVARGALIEERIDDITASCRSAHVECAVVVERGGAAFRKVRFLVIPDVRIAYIPPRDAAASRPRERGRWPRAAAGVALVRAYVGPDGTPAPPAARNRPYRPEGVLPITTAPASRGDPVAIAGFPARTFRDEPLAAFEQELSWRAPRRARLAEALYGAVHQVLRDDPDSAVARQRTRELEARSRRAAAVRGGLEAGAARRRAEWSELVSWLDGDGDDRAAARTAVVAVEEAHGRRWRTRERDASSADLEESAYFRVARAIVVVAGARVAGAAEHVDRLRRRLAPIVFDMPESDHPAVDRAVLAAVLHRAARWENINRGWLREALGMATFDRDRVDEVVHGFYARSDLHDPVVRERLFAGATVETLERSEDPFVGMALALSDQLAAIEQRERRYLGARAAVAEDYHRALAGARGALRAPDANGTLRVSFGRIRGYRPGPDEGPRPAVVAARGGDVAAFLSSADAAGGFAGAPTINRRGELTGVALERVREALGSDWVVMPSTGRTIHTHAGYLVELLRDAGADALLDELDVRDGG